MNIKRLIAVFSLALGISIGALAQETDRNKPKITVFNNLTYVQKETKANVGNVLGAIVDILAGSVTQEQTHYKEALRASIVKGISQSRRIRLMDGTGMSQADWYVDGTVSNISTTTKMEDFTDSKGKKTTKTYYKGMVGVTLQVKNAQTNQILASPTFNVSEIDFASWFGTKEEALNSAFSSLARYVTRYFDRYLPLQANIIEGASEKKDKQKEVYIDLGDATKGVCKGLHFGVYTTKIVAGKVAKKQIGKLKITEVMGDELSLCKVQSGGKDIKAAIESGESILVTSLD